MDDVAFRSPKKRGRVAVFLSGRGSNFMAIREAARVGAIDADIGLVLSNRADAPGLLKAREWGLETVVLDPKLFAAREEYDRAAAREVDARRIDLICLAGYMKVLTPQFCDAYKHRIVNIHPALLPAFPGLHVQQKAIDWGVRVSGCTVHFVAAEVDMGPIILQAAVPVLQDDTEETLAARILVEEHRVYPESVRLYFEGRLEVRGRRVFIL
ncbi:MAG TPA: phosphoribosylglycinamide formyltransferase [Terriglobales bacterium]|nr:phosphoribosylglycinamide formyltransferase [Terriglobales bacterium]